MQKKRLLKLSLMQAVCDLMRNPPLATPTEPSWSLPWTVLLTDDMRAGKVAPWPYIYLIGSSNRDLELRAPVITCDVGAPMPHVSLGIGQIQNLAKVITLAVHSVGRNPGESEDLSSYIAENLRSVPVLDYNNPLVPGSYPVIDTRPAVGGVLPPYYYPTIQVMTIDPAIQQATVQPSAAQKLQGMLVGSEMTVFKFITSF